MLVEKIRQYISGIEAVESLFGDWPHFHDAEVHSIHLDRNGPSVRLELRTPAANHGARVALDCIEIEDIELYGFNHQNVLAELVLSEHRPGALKLGLEGIFGVSGFIICRSLRVIAVETTAPQTQSPAG